MKHTFYDMNYDGKIDLVPYVNIGLNYNINYILNGRFINKYIILVLNEFLIN